MLIFVHGLNNKVDRCSVMLIDMNYMKHNEISDEIVEKNNRTHPRQNNCTCT